MRKIAVLFSLLAAGTAWAAPIVLENKLAEAGIDPALGRIVSWKRKGGANLLWNNSGDLAMRGLPGWKNHGGDKLWIVPQGFRLFAYGRETPDPDTDGPPWEVVSQSPSEVVLKSPLNRATRTISTRRITLVPDAAELKIENRVTRLEPSPLPVQLWQVTQAVNPSYSILDQAPDLYPAEPRFWKMRFYSPRAQASPLGDDALRIDIPAGDWDKFGAFGRYIGAVYDDVIFLQHFEPEPEGDYPERATIQLYGNTGYTELETYGPYVNLKRGESSVNTVSWLLLPRRKGASAAEDLDTVKTALNITAENWRQIGPGGGGRTMWCQPAPGKPQMLMCTGDMGGVFFSRNGGRDWRLMPSREIERVGYHNGTPWEHIPSRPGEIWTHSKTRGLLKSLDYGASWQAVPGAWEKLTRRDWHHSLGPGIVRFSPDGQTGLAFWNSFGDAGEKKLFASFDAGKNWGEIAVDAKIDMVRGFYFLHESKVLIVGNRAVWELDPGAGTTRLLNVQFPGNITRTALAGDGVLLVAGNQLMKLSPDGAATALNFAPDGRAVQISSIAAHGNTIYIGGRSAGHGAFIWKSSDGGRSYRTILTRDVRQADCNISRERWTTGRWGWTTFPASIAIDRNDPECVTFTDSTMCGISRNGGNSWNIISTGTLKGTLVPGGGTPMLTGWNYYIQDDRHFAATTDFAGWFTDDGGRYWTSAPPENAIWHNNIYAMAADPDDRNHLWAAASLKHDLPYWHHLITPEKPLWRGGVIESFDRGRTWQAQKPPESGLPDRPATDILASSDGTLHVAMLDAGVFRRGRQDKIWQPLNNGLPEDNRHALRVTRSPDGTLFCVITAKWEVEAENAISGGIYRFDEVKQHWNRIELPPELVFPVNLSFSADGKTMYISCFQQWREKVRRGTGAYGEPGLWIAGIDGGNARKAYSGAPVFSVTRHPAKPDYLVMATIGEGLKISRDQGKSWNDVTDLPPGNPHTVTFDPRSAEVYVTTFGQGIWRGKLPD